jgi:RHS repeat-associated protein
MYADWLLLMELQDGGTGFQPVREYTWGLDFSGQVAPAPRGRRLSDSGLPDALTAAGGIGGLLSVHDNALSLGYVYFADVQGNIGQVVDLAAVSASASMMTKYEYDAYGNRTLISSTHVQPFAFGTKYYDAESGLEYFGYRYYSPVLGRWASRDPLGEAGGDNLYSYVHNLPDSQVDPLGLIPPGGYPPYMPPPPPSPVPPPDPLTPAERRLAECGPEPECSETPLGPGIAYCLEAADCRAQKRHWAACMVAWLPGGVGGHLAVGAIHALEMIACLPQFDI